MPPVPDDLPRSPTGRVPQWVLDEQAALDRPPAGGALDHPYRRAERPPRRVHVLVVALLVATVTAVWLLNGHTEQLVAGLSGLRTVAGAQAPAPTDEAVALAAAAHLSDEGREIFYATQPEILGAAEFAGRCGAGDGRVGCYGIGGDRIVVYRAADPRVSGQAVVTVAHETLHAAWERLSGAERDALDPLLEAVVAQIPSDDEIHVQIDASVRGYSENRRTELFAYVGTQVRDVDPQLEAAYARFIEDRAALVDVYESVLGVVVAMAAEIQAASDALLAAETANAQARAQLAADMSSRDSYRQTYQEKVDEVATMSPGAQSRLRLSWVWWDGTDLRMAPAAKTLAAAADLLARDDAALSARDAALTAQEQSAATERARIDAMVADLDGLQHQLNPSAA